jgi:hypothetical protein
MQVFTVAINVFATPLNQNPFLGSMGLVRALEDNRPELWFVKTNVISARRD